MIRFAWQYCLFVGWAVSAFTQSSSCRSVRKSSVGSNKVSKAKKRKGYFRDELLDVAGFQVARQLSLGFRCIGSVDRLVANYLNRVWVVAEDLIDLACSLNRIAIANKVPALSEVGEPLQLMRVTQATNERFGLAGDLVTWRMPLDPVVMLLTEWAAGGKLQQDRTIPLSLDGCDVKPITAKGFSGDSRRLEQNQRAWPSERVRHKRTNAGQVAVLLGPIGTKGSGERLKLLDLPRHLNAFPLPSQRGVIDRDAQPERNRCGDG